VNRIIWCTPGRRDEAQLITDANRHGFSIVRRCIEAADLLAAASVDDRAAIVLDASTPRLGTDVISGLKANRQIVVLVSDDQGAALARAWGLDRVIPDSSPGFMEDLIAALNEEPSGHATLAPPSREAKVVQGQVVAVWGPTGAPGRSTIAMGLAESWAAAGERVCLIDADTISPSLAHLVGLTEDVSGLLVAARYADQGALDARSLSSACRRLRNGLWLMSGIGAAERWSQARPSALDRVWETCAQHFDRVVVDTNILLNLAEVDDPLAGALPLRDSATRSALRASDALVVITRPDALGVVRLISEFPTVQTLISHTNIDVIVNGTRRRDKGTLSNVKQVLRSAGLDLPVHGIQHDQSIAECLRKGLLLSEMRSTVKVRRALSRVGNSLAPSLVA
jgi:MinD-like ATPase involved in chromosome partitioning or flagellar assembly